MGWPSQQAPSRRGQGSRRSRAAKVLAGIDAVLVTHTHPDHWDAAAAQLVRKDAPLFIQPHDAKRIAAQGFTAARPIEASTTWNGITIARTGQHGRGEVGKRLAPVSGFALKATGAPTIYIAGDTVWCPEVEGALGTHEPDVVIVNAGAAQFLAEDANRGDSRRRRRAGVVVVPSASDVDRCARPVPAQ